MLISIVKSKPARNTMAIKNQVQR